MKPENKIMLAVSATIILVVSIIAGTIVYQLESYQAPTEYQAGTIISQRCTAFLGFCWDGGYQDTVMLANGTTITAGDTCDFSPRPWGMGGLPMQSNFSYTPKLGWAQAWMMCN